ncbi:MAG: hypothetical protein V8T91_08025 [Ruminococcus sp.]
MILFLDNYDSFTYNLYQYIGELYPDIHVVRNDEITLEEIEAMHPDALLISPGRAIRKMLVSRFQQFRSLPERCRFWVFA